MFQFFKYLFLTLGLVAAFNFFRSNQEVRIPLHFEIPLLGDFLTAPVPVFYLVIVSFFAGSFLAALLGALRFEDVSRQKKELKRLKKEMEANQVHPPLEAMQRPGDLPPIL